MRFLATIIAACLACASTSTIREGECPLPFVPLDETRCIFLDAYITYTWQEAVDLCTGHGGVLLTYEDCQTFALVYDFIRADATSTGKHYWLGITDAAEEGTWLTTAKRPVPMGVPFWGPSEPNNGDSYDCAFMHASYNHYWYDATCTSKYNAICLRNM